MSVRVTCKTCFYFEPVDAEEGTCHRYPPTPAVRIEDDEMEVCGSAWPVVYVDSWCGEFRGRH